MLVVTRQRRSWSKGSLPLRQARFRYEDVSSCLRLTAKRLNSRAETVTFDESLPARMVPVSALLAQAARGYFLDVADEQNAVAHCRVVPRPAFDGRETGELLIRGRIRTNECELSFFGEDDQVDARATTDVQRRLDAADSPHAGQQPIPHALRIHFVAPELSAQHPVLLPRPNHHEHGVRCPWQQR